MNYLENSSLLNLIFLTLSVVSILLAIYFYRKSKKEKVPLYSFTTIPLIRNNLSSIEKLRISYDGANLDNLSLTKLAFWNAGKETIKDTDFVVADHLRIFTKENIIIYDYKVELENKVNNFRIERTTPNTLLVHFDYLDINQGIVLNIYHSGKDNSEINICGSFMGANTIKEGIERKKLFNSFLNNKITHFIEESINNTNIIRKFIGLIMFIVMVFIIMFSWLPLTLIDILYDNFFNKSPKEFYLNGF